MKNFTKSVAVLFTAGVLLFSVSAKAQSFQVGTSAINLGVGFGYSYDYADGYGYGVSSTPVISASYEYGATKLGPGTLGLGIQFAYQGASYSASYPFTDYNVYNPYTGYYGVNYSYTVSSSWTTTLFGIRGVYHPDFCNGKNYDVYAALQLSYLHAGYSYSYTSSDPYGYTPYGSGADLGGSSFYPYLIIGGRYYFTDNIGVWAELGYSLAYLNLGLSIKFGGSK